MDIAMIVYETWRYISAAFIFALENILKVLGVIDKDESLIPSEEE